MADPNTHLERFIENLRTKSQAAVEGILDDARAAIAEAFEPERPVPTYSDYMWVANTVAGRLHVIRHAGQTLHLDQVEVAIFHQGAAAVAADMVARIRPDAPPASTTTSNPGAAGNSAVGFTNGSRLVTKDTRDDGLGVKGLHPQLIIVLLPHMAAWSQEVWNEIASTRRENTNVIVLVDAREPDPDRDELEKALGIVRAHVARRGLFDA